MALKQIIPAVKNKLTRAPIVSQKGTGLGTANVPKINAPAVRNPLARGR